MLNSSQWRVPSNATQSNVEDTFDHLLTSSDSHYEVTRSMLSVMSAQNALIMKLLHKQNLLYQDLQQSRTASSSNEALGHPKTPLADNQYLEQSGNHPEDDSISSLHNQRLSNSDCIIISGSNSSKISQKKLKKVVFDAEAPSSDESQQDLQAKNQPQSKNMIKNFAKGILKFIRKNSNERRRVLQELGIEEGKFMGAYEQLKGSIHSISKLRALWVEPNPFCRAFRILSFEYLRKHYLQKTFNSRIHNYTVHLKYRKRLLEALECPEDFTALKTN